MSALVFDCDGVLADTERHGHLPAFNQTFREFGLPVQWSVEEYGRRLRIGGGKERVASLLTPEFVAAAGLPTDPDAQAAEIAKWHKRKTAIYTEMVAEGKLPPRPGIRRVISAAQDAGWKLGVASTSAEAAVHAILEYAVGPERAGRFDVFLAGDCVPRKKPAPDIYQLALGALDLRPEQAVAFEDSPNGLGAAVAAGLCTVVTPNFWTEDHDFADAALVLPHLGGPDLPLPGEPGRQLQSAAWLTCDEVERIAARHATAATH